MRLIAGFVFLFLLAGGAPAQNLQGGVVPSSAVGTGANGNQLFGVVAGGVAGVGTTGNARLETGPIGGRTAAAQGQPDGGGFGLPSPPAAGGGGGGCAAAGGRGGPSGMILFLLAAAFGRLRLRTGEVCA